MNIEWLKNKTKEKFYPITHAKAVLFGNSNKTLDEEINDLNSNKLDKTTVASSSTLGLVKSGTDITVDTSGNVSVNDNSHKHTVSNISDLTATASELNVLDGITATTQELNYVDGVTSNIQTQLNSKSSNGHTHDDRYYTESEIDTTVTDINSSISSHTSNTSNPHSVTKAQVGLGNVENKSSATIRGEITKSNVTTALGYTPLNQSLKGSASGLAELDSNGKVPSSQLPSFVDDVVEGYLSGGKFYKESAHTTEISGESGKIYIDLSTEKTYRWSGSAFVVISETLALGETSSTAYRGDRGKTAYDHSQSTHARTDATNVAKSSTNGNIKINGTETTVYTHPSGTNPHGTTKSDVGLGNVDNTSDANKPISTAQKAEFDTINSNLDQLEYGENTGGKNIFDGEIELGSISVSDGQNTNDETRTRSKNFIKVKPNTTYAFTREDGVIRWVLGYKSDKTVITDAKGTQFTSALSTIPESDKIRTFTTTATTEYIRWYDTRCTNVYEKVQIEEGATATEYVPYIPSVNMLAEENAQQSIEAMDLKMLGWSVPKECPVQNYTDSDGVFHQRVGRVDLGSFYFRYYVWGIANVFSITLSDAKTNSDPKALGNLYTKKYTNDTPSNVYNNKKDKIICLNEDSIRIIDSSYTDETAFIAAMQGVYLYYELAEEKTIAVGSEAVAELKNDLSAHDTDSVKHITATERTNWNAAKTHADSAHAPSNAQANVIETVKVNGTALTPSSKAVNITVPSVGNGTVTIKQAGTSKGTFTMNQSGNTTIELTDNNTTYSSKSATSGGTDVSLVTTGEKYTWNNKANASHGNHVPATQTANNAVFLRNDNTWQTVTPANIGAAASSHTHSSYVNQNAFSNITVGSTTVSADSVTDTLTLVAGSNVTITPDATNDKITISATDTNTVTTATTTGSGNAVTAITASNGALTVTKGSTFLTAHQDISGKMDKANPTGTGSFSLNRKSGITVGNYSFAEGYNTVASKSYSHAEGGYTTASGEASHAEGHSTKAIGNYSHAEGYSTTASGSYSHAEGYYTLASGICSTHAEGNCTTASGNYSHVEGYYTAANGNYQHVQGKYNVADTTSAFIIGNGTGTSDRSNAMTVDWNGNLKTAGDITNGDGVSLNSLNSNLEKTEIKTITGDLGNTINYYKSGYIITVTIEAFTYNFTSWTNYILGVLPEGYRPKIQIHSGDTRVGSYKKGNGRIIINTNGQIILTFADNSITSLETTSLTFAI